MVDNIATNIWFSRNYASMKDIKKKMESNSEFVANKKILSELVALNYNQICS